MWRVGSLLLRGLSHLDTQTECQDYVRSDQIGDTAVLVVSDGAGSTSNGQIGANTVADCVSEYILQQAEESLSKPFSNKELFLGIVELGILDARDRIAVKQERINEQQKITLMNRVVDWLMRRETKEPEPQFVSLGDYAATLLVAIASPLETLFVHIGDGYGFGLKYQRDETFAEVTVQQVTASLPENGEYANETYFFTDEQWREHLRISGLGEGVDVAIVMSDGAEPFFVSKDKQNIELSLSQQLISIISDQQDLSISEILEKVFTSEKVHEVSSDDVSIAVAMR